MTAHEGVPLVERLIGRLVNSTLGAILLLAGFAGSVGASGSRITEMDIAGSQPVGTFAGVAYLRTYGVLHGVVGAAEPVSGMTSLPKDDNGDYQYAAQFEIVAPEPGAAANTVVLIEAENRGSPILFNALNGTSAAGAPATARYEPGLGNGFLQRHATSYARVQWQTAIASGVPGSAQGAGLVIVRDLGRLLTGRTPPTTMAGGAPPATYRQGVLGGISQSAWFVDTFIAEGFNADPGAGDRVFGAAFAIDGTGNWLAINKLAESNKVSQHPYVVPDGIPLPAGELLRRPDTDPVFVDVANYTDFYRVRASLTDIPPDLDRFRRYDWPSPHASVRTEAAAAATFKAGCNDGKPMPLNPIGYQPFLHAILLELEKTIGVPAAGAMPALPPSTLFVLGPAPASTEGFNPLPGAVLQVPRVDANAMPIGGVRFPDADYPVGRPLPAELSPVATTSIDAVCGNRGGFQPFTPAELAARYGSGQNYLALYESATRKLIAAGFVLPEDEQPMLETAARLYRNP